MSATYGSASRARELSNLFAVWTCACDMQDDQMMAIARRAINAVTAGRVPRAADMAAVEKYFR